MWQAPRMVPEAPLEQTEHGLVPGGDGWYVLNARASRWYYVEGRGAFCDLEGEQDFPQLGINVQVLGPGEAMAMYHWEADQEDFLVVAGEALLIIEGEERPLRAWDFVHCPPEHEAHDRRRRRRPLRRHRRRRAQRPGRQPDWGGYTVDEVALRHERRRRAGDERPGRGVRRRPREVRNARADALPRRLASLERSAPRPR